MANGIDLSFSTNPTAPLPDEYAYGSGGGDVQDTVVPRQDADTSEARKKNAANLEQPEKDSSEAKLQSSIYEITDGGEATTSIIRRRHHKTDHMSEEHMFVRFHDQKKFTIPPSVFVGLNYLDACLAIECSPQLGGRVKRVNSKLFEVVSKVLIISRAKSIYGAGFAWLAVPTNEYPLLQTGVLLFDAFDQTVLFKTPYKSTPKVIVWLGCINSNHEYKPRIAVSPKDIKPTGFKFDIQTFGGYSALYSGYISWFAYPADTPGICSGDLHLTYGAADIITFDKPFAKPPRRILVALNKIEIYPAIDCHFRILHEAVSERGMALRVASWGRDHSNIRKVGVSYIVME